MSVRSYSKPAARWSGNGASPSSRVHDESHGPVDEWRQRDMVILVANINRIQEMMRWPAIFRNPAKRRRLQSARIASQEALHGLQNRSGGLSPESRRAAENTAKWLGLPKVVEPTTPDVAYEFSVCDGMEKPLKPPVRRRPDDDPEGAS